MMLKSGYVACTYTALSERTGIPRTTVQHYFPNKDMLATQIMDKVSELATQKGNELAGDDGRPLVAMFLGGQVSHAMYYATPGMRQFMLDIASSRDLQHAVSPDYSKLFFHLDEMGDGEVNQRLQDNYHFANGGSFEIHYVCLKEGRLPEIARASRETFRIFARMMGVPSEECEEIVKSYSMDNETLLKIGAELVAIMESEE